MQSTRSSRWILGHWPLMLLGLAIGVWSYAMVRLRTPQGGPNANRSEVDQHVRQPQVEPEGMRLAREALLKLAPARKTARLKLASARKNWREGRHGEAVQELEQCLELVRKTLGEPPNPPSVEIREDAGAGPRVEGILRGGRGGAPSCPRYADRTDRSPELGGRGTPERDRPPGAAREVGGRSARGRVTPGADSRPGDDRTGCAGLGHLHRPSRVVPDAGAAPWRIFGGRQRPASSSIRRLASSSGCGPIAIRKS